MNTSTITLPNQSRTIKRATAAAVALFLVVVAAVALTLALRGDSNAARPSDTRSVPSAVHVPHMPGSRW
jgi:hypothetical protein